MHIGFPREIFERICLAFDKQTFQNLDTLLALAGVPQREVFNAVPAQIAALSGWQTPSPPNYCHLSAPLSY